MKRILLFVLTNLAVVLVLGVVASVLGVNRFLTANGLNLGALLGFKLGLGGGGLDALFLQAGGLAQGVLALLHGRRHLGLRVLERLHAALREGLEEFVLASEVAIAQGVRDLWRITHNLAEGSGATGLAGLHLLAPRLAGRTVGIVLCGGNLDASRAVTVLSGGTPV